MAAAGMTDAEKTAARLRDLEALDLADFLRAAAHILATGGRPGFDQSRKDGWVVVIASRPFAHRHLIAGAVWLQSGETVHLTPADFGTIGKKYKHVLRSEFGLEVVDLPG